LKEEQKNFANLDEECEHLMQKIQKIEELIKRNTSSDKKPHTVIDSKD
jgi:hypothetical protein